MKKVRGRMRNCIAIASSLGTPEQEPPAPAATEAAAAEYLEDALGRLEDPLLPTLPEHAVGLYRQLFDQLDWETSTDYGVLAINNFLSRNFEAGRTASTLSSCSTFS